KDDGAPELAERPAGRRASEADVQLGWFFEGRQVRANILDRAIGAVAPRMALKRIRARAALDLVTRAYAGAALGRHTDGWKTSPSSADSEIASAGSRLRDRHRDLVRNNPNAAKAVSSWVTNLVGDGISPRTPDPKVMA